MSVQSARKISWTLCDAGRQRPDHVERRCPDAGRTPDVGYPQADPQLATGTLTVRVARGSFANPVDSLTVDLTGGASPRQATTNAEGRAEFTGLAPGTLVKASAVVAGEKLESQEFPMPASGAFAWRWSPPMLRARPRPRRRPLRRRPCPAQPGDVVLGEDSRFVFEMGEDGLNVFYVLQVRNSASSPVQPAKPLVFELPDDARGAGLLDGSSPQAKIWAAASRFPGLSSRATRTSRSATRSPSATRR